MPFGADQTKLDYLPDNLGWGSYNTFTGIKFCIIYVFLAFHFLFFFLLFVEAASGLVFCLDVTSSYDTLQG